MTKETLTLNKLFYSLQNWETDIWIAGYDGLIILFKRYLNKLISSGSFNTIVLLAVISNTVILSLEGL